MDYLIKEACTDAGNAVLLNEVITESAAIDSFATYESLFSMIVTEADESEANNDTSKKFIERVQEWIKKISAWIQSVIEKASAKLTECTNRLKSAMADSKLAEIIGSYHVSLSEAQWIVVMDAEKKVNAVRFLTELKKDGDFDDSFEAEMIPNVVEELKKYIKPFEGIEHRTDINVDQIRQAMAARVSGLKDIAILKKLVQKMSKLTKSGDDGMRYEFYKTKPIVEKIISQSIALENYRLTATLELANRAIDRLPRQKRTKEKK